jgi:hypothetical protein
MSRLALLAACLLPLTPPPHAARAQTTADLSPEVMTRLGLPPGALAKLTPVATSPAEGYTAEQATVNAPDILALSAAHVGGQRLLFRTTFARPPDFGGATLIIYLELDNDLATGRQDQPEHRGVDLMIVVSDDQLSLNPQNPAYAGPQVTTHGAKVGNELYVTLDAPLPTTGDTIPIGAWLLSERQGGRTDATPRATVQLPRAAGQVAALPGGGQGSLRSLDDYRYHDDLVVYEKLSDKGLRGAQVAPDKPFQPGRVCPEPLFTTTPRQPGKRGNLTRTQVRVSLLEECGVARPASPVSFGFPCPQGGVFSLANIRLLDATGKGIPAQFTITAFWPDGSLKWVLVDFVTALKPSENKTVIVELGSRVKRAAAKSPLQVRDEPGQTTLLTGSLRHVINKQRFSLLDPGQPGMVLRDEQGQEFTSAGVPPDRVVIEQQGPVKAVVRVEGRYATASGATYLRYIARLTFWAGSPRVGVAWTTVNDYLKTEFTDITSLSLPLTIADPRQAQVYTAGPDGKLQGKQASRFSLFQADDRRGSLRTDSGTTTAAGRAPGVTRIVTDQGALTVALHDFWQRWPKGLEFDGRQLNLQLLPPQPGSTYGTDLPHYLLFNLCEGKYRFKWGMAFTERFTLDFGRRTTAEELYADANKPVVAVLPASWYARTQALGRVAPPLGKQFAVWDRFVAEGLKAYLTGKERQREYGFLNYGDWYGERGRNWGNNEYDLGHGLFQQFLRTGHRDYYRWAVVAARHQADVDTIHAYPDGFYVGGQVPHSVGHTGQWSETLEHGTWEKRYDGMDTAANGHCWTDGLVDAWCLGGEAGVMQSALLFGEHVAWAMSPTFKELGTHERDAGWSLKAIMALYRQTHDPAYLAAARRIAAVPLREQKFDQGGAWPHLLPLDHSNGQPNVVGNNLFLVGVLLGGLQAYDEAQPDPAVRKSLISGARWVAKSWDEAAGGWPYSATPEGKPLYPASTSLNMLIIQPLAYVARLTNDPRLWHIVDGALGAVAIGGGESFGKSLGQQLHFAGGTLALLQEHYALALADRGANTLSGNAAWYAGMMAKTPDAAKHSARAPDEKVFVVRLKAAPAELQCDRTPHGAMTKRSPTGTLRVLSAQGATVGESSFSTDDPHEYRCALPGQPGDQFRVVVNDDQRGVWTLRGAEVQVVMQTTPGFHIGGVGKGKYHFFVPAGTKQFRVKLLGIHTGGYGAVVMSPGGKVVGQHDGANPGSDLIPGAKQDMPQPPGHPEQAEIVVKPVAADTSKLWSLVLWAAGDIGVELVGVPPYLALTEGDWFAVGR